MNENIIKLILQHIEKNKCEDCDYQENINLNDKELNISISETDKEELLEVSLLYAVQFNSANYDSKTNTFNCQNVKILEFADRPFRFSNYLSLKEFQETWDVKKKDNNSFISDPPNVVVYVNNQMYKVVFELNQIDNQNDSISFKVLDYINSDLLPNGDYLEGVLFIDSKKIQSQNILKNKLNNWRFQKASDQLSYVAPIKKTRNNIARIKTVLNQRRLS